MWKLFLCITREGRRASEPTPSINLNFVCRLILTEKLETTSSDIISWEEIEIYQMYFNEYVEGIFCSFVIIFIFVVPCVHKHLRTEEWMSGCWVEASITWSPLKFITLRYSFGFSMSRFCTSISSFCSGTDDSNSLYSTRLTRSSPNKGHRVHKYYA